MIEDEIRVWRTITWPFLKDFTRDWAEWYVLSFIPPAFQSWSLELELRRAMNKEEKS